MNLQMKVERNKPGKMPFEDILPNLEWIFCGIQELVAPQSNISSLLTDVSDIKPHLMLNVHYVNCTEPIKTHCGSREALAQYCIDCTSSEKIGKELPALLPGSYKIQGAILTWN